MSKNDYQDQSLSSEDDEELIILESLLNLVKRMNAYLSKMEEKLENDSGNVIQNFDDELPKTIQNKNNVNENSKIKVRRNRKQRNLVNRLRKSSRSSNSNKYRPRFNPNNGPCRFSRFRLRDKAYQCNNWRHRKFGIKKKKKKIQKSNVVSFNRVLSINYGKNFRLSIFNKSSKKWILIDTESFVFLWPKMYQIIISKPVKYEVKMVNGTIIKNYGETIT